MAAIKSDQNLNFTGDQAGSLFDSGPSRVDARGHGFEQTAAANAGELSNLSG